MEDYPARRPPFQAASSLIIVDGVGEYNDNPALMTTTPDIPTIHYMDAMRRRLLSSRATGELAEVVLLTLTRISTWLALATSVSAAALLFAGCAGESPAATAPAAAPDPTSPPSQASGTGHEVGQKAPGFELTTVDGEQVSLDGYRGQPLLLYFYATW